MPDDIHLIGKLDIQATFADVDTAYALRPCIENLGWQLMPRLMERVFDAVMPAGVHVRLTRLDLDLGTVRPEHLQEDALHRLEQALGDALAQAVFEARQGHSREARLLAPAQCRLDQFDEYLRSGHAPFASLAQPFDARARLHQLVAEQPAALVALLRKHAHDRLLLERLVLQADAAGLQAVLGLLAPAEAATILGLLRDLVEVHGSTSLPTQQPVSRAALERLVWITTMQYLLHDGGTPFHRVQYLGYVLEREAARLGMDYKELLQLMSAAVAKAARRSALRSSMPAALAQLVAAQQLSPGPPEDSRWPQGGESVWVPALRAAQGGRFEALLGWMRRLAGQPRRLEDLARAMGNELFAQLVQHRLPDDAKGLLADLDRLGAQAGAASAPLLRACVLHGMVSVGGGPVDRKTLQRHWLAALAQRAAELSGKAASREESSRGASDTLLRLEQWLSGDSPPGVDGLNTAPAESLLGLPHADIRRLLSSANAEHAEARLRRAMSALSPEQQWMLLSKLDQEARPSRAHLAGELKTMGQAKRFDRIMQAARAALARQPQPALLQASALELSVPEAGSRPASISLKALKALLAWPDGGALRSPSSLQAFMRLLKAEDGDLQRYLQARRSHARLHAPWAARLPSAAFRRLLESWQPRSAPVAYLALQLLQQAWRETAPLAVRSQTRRTRWSELLTLLSASHPADDLNSLVSALISRLGSKQPRQAKKRRVHAPVLQLRSHVGVRLSSARRAALHSLPKLPASAADRASPGSPKALRRTRHASVAGALSLVRRSGHSAIATLLRRPAKPAAKPAVPPPQPAVPRLFAQADEPKHALYVRNAGLVLFNPFLPTLFERLGLLTPDAAGVPRVLGLEAVSRACHLLQYLVDGVLDQPEHQLPLNKLLAGQALEQPIMRHCEPVPEDLAVCDELLQQITAHWPVLRNTTAPVLRKTFLQREGRLLRKGGSWTLQVQRETVDVLIDQCPWPVSMVYHPWMQDPLYVSW